MAFTPAYGAGLRNLTRLPFFFTWAGLGFEGLRNSAGATCRRPAPSSLQRGVHDGQGFSALRITGVRHAQAAKTARTSAAGSVGSASRPLGAESKEESTADAERRIPSHGADLP
jgi:hypothetical protein